VRGANQKRAGQTGWRTENTVLVGVERKGADDVADGVVSGEGVRIVVEFDGVDVHISAAGDVCGHDGLSVVGEVWGVEDEVAGGAVDDGADANEVDFLSGIDGDVGKGNSDADELGDDDAAEDFDVFSL
tara:strand:- start:1142 stop:1528 length:387 start_codon:yes stop_codon:yes gene_type:complete